jgi:hypothetical protein
LVELAYLLEREQMETSAVSPTLDWVIKLVGFKDKIATFFLFPLNLTLPISTM